jgi:hypothetical protein
MMNAATLSDWTETVDQYGKAGWITLMVVGFVLFWPVGLAILAYLIWSGRMGCKGRRNRNYASAWGGNRNYRMRSSSGNNAFDEYREETLRRLEEEQNEFSSFLDQLRKAKDKAEFDQFMGDRQKPTSSDESVVQPAP